MTVWRDVALHEVATISWGDTTTTKSSYVDRGFVAYSATGPDGFLPYADHSEDGVVISAIGARCGKTWYAAGSWSCIKNTMWMRGQPGLNTRYLYYATCRPELWPRRGAAQPFIGLGDAKAMRLHIPDEPVQIAIVAVLGAIDDLIENNRRRVEVLEEMARSIYREWFVKFRYPGHGDVPMVDSALGPIPEGWGMMRVRDVSEVVRGRSYRSTELVDEGGLPFVNLKCMARGGGFRRDGLKRYIGPYKGDQVVSEGDIVLAVTDLTQGREILARATRVPRLAEGRGIISLDVVRVVPTDEGERLWIYAALGWSDFSDRVKEYANGSTVLHLSPKHVEEAEILWAPEPARKRFMREIAPMLAQVDELSDQTSVLTRLRDLLLPKLVTGQIDVSTLGLDALITERVA